MARSLLFHSGFISVRCELGLLESASPGWWAVHEAKCAHPTLQLAPKSLAHWKVAVPGVGDTVAAQPDRGSRDQFCPVSSRLSCQHQTLPRHRTFKV